MDALGGVLEELRADVDLFRVQKGCAVHRRQFVPLVDDLYADTDALEALINFSQILENLKKKQNLSENLFFRSNSVKALPCRQSSQLPLVHCSVPCGSPRGIYVATVCCQATARERSCAPRWCGGC